MSARRTKSKTSEAPSFEDRLTELQEIVAALEDGDLPLLASIEKYRAGIAALTACRTLLDGARRTVEMLSREAVEKNAAAEEAEDDATAFEDADEENEEADEDGEA